MTLDSSGDMFYGTSITIGADGLDGQALLSYKIFLRDLQNDLDGDRFPGELQPIEQFNNFATLAVMHGSGLDLAAAMPLANRAAGIVVGKLGTAVATLDELKGGS